MSNLKSTPGKIPGLVHVEPAVFPDDRGYFTEIHSIHKYAEIGIDKPFLQDNYSYSTRGVLRGLHYQLKKPQGKLLSVIRGEIHDVAVDIRKGSPTFGQWESYVLSEENHHQLYVPEGFAHGFIVLSDNATVLYKCTDVYAPGDEYGVKWNDPEVGVDWQGGEPVLSEKDDVLPLLRDIPEDQLPVYNG